MFSYVLKRNWRRILTPATISMILCLVDIILVFSKLDSTMGFSLLLLPFYLIASFLLFVLDFVMNRTIVSIKRIWYIQLCIIFIAGLLSAYYLKIFPGCLLYSILMSGG